MEEKGLKVNMGRTKGKRQENIRAESARRVLVQTPLCVRHAVHVATRDVAVFQVKCRM